VFFVAASTANFWKRHISSASERAFPGFFGDIFGCSTPSKKRCFSTPEFTRFLSTVSSQCRATRSDVSFQERKNLKVHSVGGTLRLSTKPRNQVQIRWRNPEVSFFLSVTKVEPFICQQIKTTEPEWENYMRGWWLLSTNTQSNLHERDRTQKERTWTWRVTVCEYDSFKFSAVEMIGWSATVQGQYKKKTAQNLWPRINSN